MNYNMFEVHGMLEYIIIYMYTIIFIYNTKVYIYIIISCPRGGSYLFYLINFCFKLEEKIISDFNHIFTNVLLIYTLVCTHNLFDKLYVATCLYN